VRWAVTKGRRGNHHAGVEERHWHNPASGRAHGPTSGPNCLCTTSSTSEIEKPLAAL